MQANNIFLIGPMGAGKTTIGKLLAKELGWEFIDIDHYIEEKTGVDVKWIFDVEGEDSFRKRETQALRELANKSGIVLSTGGGTVLELENRAVLAAHGMVIYLYVSLGQQIERVRLDKKRPLITGEGRNEVLSDMYDERAVIYEELADFTFQTCNKGAVRVVKNILVFLRKDEVN